MNKWTVANNISQLMKNPYTNQIVTFLQQLTNQITFFMLSWMRVFNNVGLILQIHYVVVKMRIYLKIMVCSLILQDIESKFVLYSDSA